MTTQIASALIYKYCVKLGKIHSIRALKHGFYNWVFLVNNTLVFRFAKHTSYNPIIEQKVLDYLHQHTTISIPKIYDVHQNPDFIVVDYLPGFAPSPADFYSWNSAQKYSTASTLSHFLATLHNFCIDKSWQQTDILSYNFEKEVTDIQTETEVALQWPELTDATKTYIQDQSKIAIQWMQNATPECLIHNDIHTENLLFLKPGTLTGVIDFDSAVIGSPTLDFALLGSTMGWQTLLDSVDLYHAYSDYRVDPLIAWAINVEYIISLICKSDNHENTVSKTLFLWWLNTARPGIILTASDFPSNVGFK